MNEASNESNKDEEPSEEVKCFDPKSVEPEDENDNEEKPTLCQKVCKRLYEIYDTYMFLILVVISLPIAYAYPPLGAKYLAPQITASWVAVLFIFLLSGIGLKTQELVNAFSRLKFNFFVQVFNFGVVSVIVYGFSRLMLHVGALSAALADGMVIGACVPITINMVMVLTKSANGDEASAVFNAAFGNLVAVFLSPALILGYLGVKGDIELGKVFFKLSVRVILPLFIGQIIQKFVPSVSEFVKNNKKNFKRAQEYSLSFIVYTVFCKTFQRETDTTVGDTFLMIALQFVLLCTVMSLAWFALKLFFRDEPKLRVMGLFGCSHKSVAMGIPLITTIYDDNPMIGFYTLPLIIWHPMQLVIGTALAPKLVAFVKSEEERLNGGGDGFAALDVENGDNEQNQ